MCLYLCLCSTHFCSSLSLLPNSYLYTHHCIVYGVCYKFSCMQFLFWFRWCLVCIIAQHPDDEDDDEADDADDAVDVKSYAKTRFSYAHFDFNGCFCIDVKMGNSASRAIPLVTGLYSIRFKRQLHLLMHATVQKMIKRNERVRARLDGMQQQ